MKRIVVLSFLVCAFLGTLKAQSDIDAFMFSQSEWNGTARFCGAGSAFGAAGAEFSALSTNPASIGVYKKHEVTLTPLVVSILKTNSLYNNNRSKYLASTYDFTNVGAVFAFTQFSNPLIKSMQFGFGLNNIYDFSNEYNVSGTSLNSSLMDEYVSAANSSNSLSSFNTQLAWDTWLMDYDSTNSEYYSPLEKQPLYQSRYVRTTGGINELLFSFGGNINDQFYFGASLGIPFLEYSEKCTYTEEDDLDTIGGFDKFTAHFNSKTEGIGINLKLGILYQPADFVRFGIAFHTPTYYGKLKNSYNNDITAVYSTKSYYAESPEGFYNYKLTTPMRLMANVAFFIKKRAFIGAEYEYTNYSLATMYTYGNDRYSFSEENQNIKNKYKSQHIVRIGGEVIITDHFLARLGYIYKSSPYQNNINDGSSHTGSIGVGFRAKKFFCDLAYQMKLTKEKLWIYNPEFVNNAENRYYQHRIMATVGFKF